MASAVVRAASSGEHSQLGVRDDQSSVRRSSAKAFSHAFELRLRATGETDARFLRRRAREILRRELADEASRAEEGDIEVAHPWDANDQPAVAPDESLSSASRLARMDVGAGLVWSD